jgi:hypothetical protein
MDWFWWFDLNVAKWMELFKLGHGKKIGCFYENKYGTNEV